MKLTLDFETRSRAEIKDCGGWKYAEDQSTEVLCLAVKVDNEPPAIWTHEKWKPLVALTGLKFIDAETVWKLCRQADTITAHNCEFESAIWYEVMHKRLGWPDLYEHFEKLRCSAAKAATCSLPRHLAMAGRALNLPVQKDTEGGKVMMKMCKPRKPTKNDPTEWVEDDASLMTLFTYCARDADAEHVLDAALPDITPTELEVWRVDQIINHRGIPIAVDDVEAVIAITNNYQEVLTAECAKITGGEVESPTQVAALLQYINDRFMPANGQLDSLDKNMVLYGLSIPDLHPIAKRLLQIRQAAGKTSVAKYVAIMEGVSADRRCRGTMLYHAASTGRWGGRRVQPHNLPRKSIPDPDKLMQAIRYCTPAIIENWWGEDIMQLASKTVRHMICAAPGKILRVGDFKSIEAIITAWVAGEQKTLDAFVAGLDLYIVAAQDVYHNKYEEVTKRERQVGKVVVLALGFQGGKGAFETMQETYKEDMEPVPHDQIKVIVKAWRAANPNIVAFWKQIQAAAISAVNNPGTTTEYRGIQFKVWRGFLCLRLPSGRVLYYHRPGVEDKIIVLENDDGTTYKYETRGLTYWGTDSATHQWSKQETYGGSLTENIVQAIARDLLANAMLTAERKGYSVVMTVHDEVVAETPKDFGSVGEFNKLICELPPWAAGLPLMADSWEGERYKK